MQVDEALELTMKYASKPAFNTNVQMQKTPKCQVRRLLNSAKDNMRNEIWYSLHAKVIGTVKASWSVYKIRCPRLITDVEVPSIHLEIERTILIRGSASTVHLNVGDLTSVRYFKGPRMYSSLVSRFLWAALPVQPSSTIVGMAMAVLYWEV